MGQVDQLQALLWEKHAIAGSNQNNPNEPVYMQFINKNQ
jgi:hypothetical protein